MLEIKAPGWQEEDDKLVQKKLNWDLAAWKSNRNSKVFLLKTTDRSRALKPLKIIHKLEGQQGPF